MMKLLVDLTIGSATIRVSTRAQKLENYLWLPRIKRFNNVKYGLPCDYGGYAKVQLTGKIEIVNTAFKETGNWPPPVSMSATVRQTLTTEAAAVTLFTGTFHLDRIGEQTSEFDMYGDDDFDQTETDQAYSGTLVQVFQSHYGTLGLTSLNTTYARSPSPDVSYTASGENLLIDDLSDIAKFLSHWFYIDKAASTLHLVDMMTDVGSISLKTDQFRRGTKLPQPNPVSLVKCSQGGNEYSVSGDYSYGKKASISPVCHTTQTNIEDALADIYDLIKLPRLYLKAKLDNDIVLGRKVTVEPRYLQPLTAWARARKITYDHAKQEMIIEGEGNRS